MPVRLTLGGGKRDWVLERADELLVRYRTDDGLRYLDYEPSTPRDRLVPDDLAVTILINSRATGTAFKSVQDHGNELDLLALPPKSFEDTDAIERSIVADVIAQVASWPGFAASVATKVLHKKRSALIPILDNEAIFGAYMSADWPERRASQDSVKSRGRISDALERICFDLQRSENKAAWNELRKLEPVRSLIELFDMVWWIHFRDLQPVRPTSPV